MLLCQVPYCSIITLTCDNMQYVAALNHNRGHITKRECLVFLYGYTVVSFKLRVIECCERGKYGEYAKRTTACFLRSTYKNIS